ncbi:MAG: hypothetical protein LBG87_05795 [Spirochaetaceae bacterium]|jgi:hypothetical protein|nr:hypothetical protein [Spirochaetaceae bacterium]
MLSSMTLSERNTIFKVGIFLPAAVLAGVAVTLFLIIPTYPSAMGEAVRRSSGIMQSLTARFFQPSPYAPVIAMAGAVLYALIALIIIYCYFEKTQSPEILYIAFFALSFALEGTRIMTPLKLKYDLPSIYLIMASRVMIFGRYFGIFSLFAASVYAAGLAMQQQRHIVFIIVLLALAITLGVPIDGLVWDSSLCMISGYTSMFTIVEAGIIAVTLASFFISAYSRGIKEYVFIGVGAFLAVLGRSMLFSADTWVTPLPALLMLIAGTWFICTRLHQVYLWH